MKIKLTQLLTALALTLCIISVSVVITLNFRPLYYFDIGYFDLVEKTGYTEEMIRENYDVLIDYNSVFFRDALEFPSLPMSEQGRIHFVEVKNIFVFIQAVLLPVSLIGSIIGILALKKQKPAYLKLTSVLSIGLPALLGILIALNWDRFFVIFHEIFFNNDYWIFDYKTDPVIRILPDGFFMHCALMILLLIVLGSLICFIIYRRQISKFSGSNAAS
ncbi:TIGR01906 family membrane protein [Frisingicoccus sp.]|uniref:TIGR01906 family membrane protein n=1 Tax=Frisingicoccus sp. TaxID=1918627 RepID=UPI002EC7BE76|nr:TIGR01906 family membrane protein [Frisingicoccus sp.]